MVYSIGVPRIYVESGSVYVQSQPVYQSGTIDIGNARKRNTRITSTASVMRIMTINIRIAVWIKLARYCRLEPESGSCVSASRGLLA